MKKIYMIIFFLNASISSHAQFSVSPVLHTFDILNYKLNLDLYKCYASPYHNHFSATDEITFVADSSISSIKLNATSKRLMINSVAGAASSFIHINDTLVITLNKKYNAGDTLSIKIFYENKNGSDGSSFNASGGYVFTDCEPEGARNWFPCWDKPSDKATTDITAKVPSNVLLGSNGSLIDSVKIKDSIWYHWVSKDPVATYLVVLASKSNYLKDVFYWHHPVHLQDSIPVEFYHVAGETALANAEANVTSMLDYQSSLFGNYPFEKVGFASANKNFYSEGMEDQTMIIVCNNCWSESLIFHELTHHWFGDLISPKSWADIFMNEGFAAYSESLWKEHSKGYGAARLLLENDAQYYLSHNKGFPISDSLWAFHTPPFDTLFNAGITYDKGACILDQLRYVLGDSLFFQTIKAYAANTSFMYKNVSVKDFNRFINFYTNKNYDWFFNEWIFSPNHPVYKNTSSITQSGSNWKVSFTVHQVQTNTVFFKMPVQFQIKFTRGKDSLITVMNDENDQTFSFNFSIKPKVILFDPNDRILLKEISSGLIKSKENPDTYVSSIFVYPNPSSNIFNTEFYLSESDNVRIELEDILGNSIKKIAAQNYPKGLQVLSFNAKNLTAGIYFIKIFTSKHILSKEIIVK